MPKTITILAMSVSALALAASANAKTYVPKRNAPCRAGFAAGTAVKRELKTRHHKLVWVPVKIRECVSEPPAPPVITTSTPTLTYQAALTSAVTASVSSPLAVTYDYSADAILNGGSLAAEGQLPPGLS